MNSKRRELLKNASQKIDAAKSFLDTAKETISDVYSEEEDAKYSLEEHFSETERYYTMEANVDILEAAETDLGNTTQFRTVC